MTAPKYAILSRKDCQRVVDALVDKLHADYNCKGYVDEDDRKLAIHLAGKFGFELPTQLGG